MVTITEAVSVSTVIAEVSQVLCLMAAFLHSEHKGPLAWHDHHIQNALYLLQYKAFQQLDMVGIQVMISPHPIIECLY